MKNKFGVLGLGHWGTALSEHLAKKGFSVLAWSIEEKIVSGINKENINPEYLSNITLSKNLTATTELSDLEEVDYLLSVLPAIALKDVFPKVKVSSGKFISATKDFDPETYLTPIELAKKLISGIRCSAVISGPGFAKDIAAGLPAGIVAAADDKNFAREVAEIFTADNLKVYTSTDIIGVELGGTVKNIIAIAAGVSDGLELGDSARAGIITRGLAEMMRLAESMGAKRETLAGLSGMGDLVLTATCDNSRNRTVGICLGKGKSLEESIKLAGSTAEGVTATKVIYEISKKYNVNMPVTEAVLKLLNSEVTPNEILESLISRPLKDEF